MNLGTCPACGNPITLGRTGPWCAVYGSHNGQFVERLLRPRPMSGRELLERVYGPSHSELQ